MEPYVDKVTFDDGTSFIVTNELGELGLASFFLLMDRGGLLPIVYHQSIPRIRNWLEWHEQPENIWLACLVEKDGQAQIAGMMWVNAIEQRGPAVRAAEVGHCFLREYHRFLNAETEIPRTFVEMGLRYLFGRCGITVLLGTTPVPNRPAIRFIAKCGFTQSQPIPGYASWQDRPCAAVLSWMTKETWLEIESAKAGIKPVAEPPEVRAVAGVTV